MKEHALAGDIEGAITYFAHPSQDRFRQAFISVGGTDLSTLVGQIGATLPIFVKVESAQYYFEQVVNGETIAFPIDFVRENGVWKIIEF